VTENITITRVGYCQYILIRLFFTSAFILWQVIVSLTRNQVTVFVYKKAAEVNQGSSIYLTFLIEIMRF